MRKHCIYVNRICEIETLKKVDFVTKNNELYKIDEKMYRRTFHYQILDVDVHIR